MKDTITAVATAPGRGLTAIVRVSGPRALSIAADLLPEGPKVRDLKGFAAPPVTLVLRRGRRIPARLLVMRSPFSYTTEDTVEFFLPGSPPLAGAVLKECLEKGARLAGPGEFTRRAYLNGRIDGVEVEGVLALIESDSDEQRAAAMERLRGRPSQEAAEVRDRLLRVLAAVEAYLDFEEEDTEALDLAAVRGEIEECARRLERIKTLLGRREPPRGEPRVVILGPPNAGKSSLFGALVPGGKAIVSAVPGTTRDLIEGSLSHGGRRIRLFDAPGVMDTEDPLERLALSNLEGMMGSVQACIFLFDGSIPPGGRAFALLEELCARRPRVLGLNKADRGVDPSWRALHPPGGFFEVSALRRTGLRALLDALVRKLPEERGPGGAAMDIRVRAAVEGALSAMREALAEDRVLGLERVSLGIREALEALGGLASPLSGDELLDAIFSRFCVGK